MSLYSLDSFDKQFENSNISQNSKNSLNINSDLEKENKFLKAEILKKNIFLKKKNSEFENLKIKIKYLEEEKEILEFSNNKLKSKIDILKKIMEKKNSKSSFFGIFKKEENKEEILELKKNLTIFEEHLNNQMTKNEVLETNLMDLKILNKNFLEEKKKKKKIFLRKKKI